MRTRRARRPNSTTRSGARRSQRANTRSARRTSAATAKAAGLQRPKQFFILVFVYLQIAIESDPFTDFERQLATALPGWQQQYARLDVEASDFVFKKEFEFRYADFQHTKQSYAHFSARLYVPTTAETVALMPPPSTQPTSVSSTLSVRFACRFCRASPA